MTISRYTPAAAALCAALALAACKNNNNGFSADGTGAPASAVAASPQGASGSAAAQGTAFLEANKTAPGVKTTTSGLQYKITQEGSGKKPAATDMVTVRYEGRLIDGTVFDSTEKQGGTPATFPLNGVIPGWTEGLQLIKEGGKATLYIPAALAYGSQSPAEIIPPDSTLIFDVELVKVGS